MPVRDAFSLLMLVTPIDLSIAAYSIKALKRAFLLYEGMALYVYANGLNDAQEGELAALAETVSPRIRLISNRDRMEAIRDRIRIGETYVTDQGTRAFREGNYENGSEVWSRELVTLPTEIVGIIDADLEILDYAFLGIMLEAFAQDPRLGIYSTDYSATRTVFDSYSNQRAHIAARHHTWFCMYRRSALEACSDFTYYEEPGPENLPIKFDHSAKLQEVLTTRHGFAARTLGDAHRDDHIHYGAFAKNRSLKGWRLGVYRILRIARHNGYVHMHQSAFLKRVIRGLSRRLYDKLGMNAYEAERSRYLFQ